MHYSHIVKIHTVCLPITQGNYQELRLQINGNTGMILNLVLTKNNLFFSSVKITASFLKTAFFQYHKSKKTLCCQSKSFKDASSNEIDSKRFTTGNRKKDHLVVHSIRECYFV